MRMIYRFLQHIIFSIRNFLVSEKGIVSYKNNIKNFIVPEKDIICCKDSIYEKHIINPIIFFTKIYYWSIELLLLNILLLYGFTELNLLASIIISILFPLILLFLSYRIYYFIYCFKNKGVKDDIQSNDKKK